MDRTEMLRRLEAGEDPLEVSILKWQEIVDGKGEDNGYRNCALCQVNRFIHTEFCKGACPVKHAGYENCIGTPYSKYSDAAKERFKKYWAKKELEFLKSLRKTP